MIPKRHILIFTYDLLAIPIAWLLAYWIRFNFAEIPPLVLMDALKFLPAVVLVQTSLFGFFGIYRSHWRFVSIPDIIRILQAVSVGALCVLLILFFYPHQFHLNNLFPPRSVFLMYVFILIALLSGARLSFRWLKDFAFKPSKQKRVLIIGAGAAGDALARDLLRDPNRPYRLVAYLDDNSEKKGTEIQGIRVVGTSSDLVRTVKSLEIELVLIAIPSAKAVEMRRLVEQCNLAKVNYRTLPGLSALASGDVTIRDLREVSLEDLLGRAPINFQDNTLISFFRNTKIMITGAGGSIGSELCRQLAKLQLNTLILIDNCEFNLYSIDMELKQSNPLLTLKSYLQDITEQDQVLALIKNEQPEIIFHTAAYKHVPLLESQIAVAVHNNIMGTRAIAEAAVKTKVKKFILVSTDKAVNPTNVMGATKRVAELLCQNYNAQQTNTQFITVRFGNVLGSAGSVVPLFKKQREQGGPLTITHPDMSRYFMTIPEASQLILRASVMGQRSKNIIKFIKRDRSREPTSCLNH
jgi:FlaA1/EpsC-like NDP-sugar epimerase